MEWWSRRLKVVSRSRRFEQRNQVMAIRKRKYKSGKVTWEYVFEASHSTRENRKQITESGFATKREAEDAEAARRIRVDEQYKAEQKGVTRPIPQTLQDLLTEFLTVHCERNLESKTVERYREMVVYLAPELLALRHDEITSLYLNREWNRLLDSGGHHRKTRKPRSLSVKSVKNIAGMVSSAFNRAIFWGLASVNPVTHSEVPKHRRKDGIALTPGQQSFMIEACTHWALPAILEMDAALGARRGEILALRWSDIVGNQAVICRSLSQTKAGLQFKETKTPAGYRYVVIPESALKVLKDLRKKQEEFRAQFGKDYRSDLDLIFCNPDGSPLKPNSISGTVSALFRRLKPPKGASLQSLRHTHGSHLLAAGIELIDVSRRLGHANVRVTAEVYAHALPGRDEEAAQRWDAFQKREPAEANDTAKRKTN